MMLLALILWLFGEDQRCKADHEDYMQKQIRESNRALQELLETERARRAIEEQLALQRAYRESHRRITRSYAKDKDGRIVAQEIIEEV